MNELTAICLMNDLPLGGSTACRSLEPYNQIDSAHQDNGQFG